MSVPAILALEDGSVFRGVSIGASGTSVGEVVFNTAMSGYQEILTDPSYARQIVTLTYPHIGNTGTNAEDEESRAVWAAGLVIRDLPLLASNYRNQQALDDYLRAHGIVGIADIDTRRLTRILREKGARARELLLGARTAQLLQVLLRILLGVVGGRDEHLQPGEQSAIVAALHAIEIGRGRVDAAEGECNLLGGVANADDRALDRLRVLEGPLAGPTRVRLVCNR